MTFERTQVCFQDSSDENEVPKRKLNKMDKLDFESIFGPDKAEKARKAEKERKEKQRIEGDSKKKDKKDVSKRRGDIHGKLVVYHGECYSVAVYSENCRVKTREEVQEESSLG